MSAIAIEVAEWQAAGERAREERLRREQEAAVNGDVELPEAEGGEALKRQYNAYFDRFEHEDLVRQLKPFRCLHRDRAHRSTMSPRTFATPTSMRPLLI